MNAWIRKYDQMRTDPDRRFRIPSIWHSDKFDLENMDWSQIKEIWLPELGCKWGGACQALRKNWFKYKMEKREGGRGWDTILKINRIQRALGIKMTDFRMVLDLIGYKLNLILKKELELNYQVKTWS